MAGNSQTRIVSRKAQRQSTGIPIIGIGASAGGLVKFQRFFSEMPSDSGAAFIVIQHAPPDARSALTQLLQRRTNMEVAPVEDGVAPRPNTGYVSPSDKQLALIDGTFQLMEPRGPHATWLPINFAFRCLAEEMGRRAIGVILSGSGSDGTEGIKAIHRQGGIVLAEDPDLAEQAGMPQSAIDTGLVDHVLPADQMPSRIIQLLHHPYLSQQATKVDERADDTLQKILVLIRHELGTDFSQYKRSTIQRRVQRRMSINHLESLPEYFEYLVRNTQEVRALFRDFLIGATSFFRDQSSLEGVKQEVFPEILGSKSPSEMVRIWNVGCSTGEEAYSLAMLLAEHQEQAGSKPLNVRIFASDIDEEAIEKAREGLYPGSIVSDVGRHRLARFFVTEQRLYRVKKEIRDMLVFCVHNVAKDPPFSKIDLICCRNLLIYFTTELQRKVLETLHYALNPTGFLFLGASESIGGVPQLFSPVNPEVNLFKRREASRSSVPFETSSFPIRRRDPAINPQPTGSSFSIKEERLKELLLENIVTACVIVNERNEIVYTYGKATKFFGIQPGRADLNIINMAPQGLRAELVSGLEKAREEHRTVQTRNVPLHRIEDRPVAIDLKIVPVDKTKELHGLAMVFCDLTEDQVAPEESEGLGVTAEGKTGGELQQELESTRDRLRATVEDLETSNEELQSSNEELQSTNQELETSQEELRSTNEELSTVNAEYQEKLEELNRVKSDVENLLESTDVACIVLDEDLHVKRFTPQAHQMIRLINADIGRPVTQIASNLHYEKLEADSREVLRTLSTLERELEMKSGAWVLLRIMPYRTAENIIEGVVIVFIDISKRKNIEQELEQAREEIKRLKGETK